MTMIEARPSMTEPNAQPTSEIELAATPALRPRLPSPVIHARENQGSALARRAARSQTGWVFGAVACSQLYRNEVPQHLHHDSLSRKV
jgi:hypothetical protein